MCIAVTGPADGAVRLGFWLGCLSTDQPSRPACPTTVKLEIESNSGTGNYTFCSFSTQHLKHPASISQECHNITIYNI